MSKTWGFLFGGSGHGSESSCQISAYYKFFPGKSYFYRTKRCNCKNVQKERLVYAVSAPGRLRGKSGEGEFILYSILQKHLF